jgi:hypothetical protein
MQRDAVSPLAIRYDDTGVNVLGRVTRQIA